MNKLETLYASIKGLEKVGLTLTDEMLKKADELEEQLIKTEVLPTLSKDIEPRLSQIQRELVLVVEYKPGEPISVALSRKTKISEIVDAKTLTPKANTPVSSQIKPLPTESHFPTKYTKNATKGMRVSFPDGTVIWHHAAIDTFVDAIRKIGLEKVNAVGLEHAGYNLVSKKMKPLEPGRVWQHECDGWYVFSNINNKNKIQDLKRISEYYHLHLKIEEVKPSH